VKPESALDEERGQFFIILARHGALGEDREESAMPAL